MSDRPETRTEEQTAEAAAVPSENAADEVNEPAEAGTALATAPAAKEAALATAIDPAEQPQPSRARGEYPSPSACADSPHQEANRCRYLLVNHVVAETRRRAHTRGQDLPSCLCVSQDRKAHYLFLFIEVVRNSALFL